MERTVKNAQKMVIALLKNASQTKLSEASGINQVTLANLKNGKATRITNKVWARLVKVYNGSEAVDTVTMTKKQKNLSGVRLKGTTKRIVNIEKAILDMIPKTHRSYSNKMVLSLAGERISKLNKDEYKTAIGNLVEAGVLVAMRGGGGGMVRYAGDEQSPVNDAQMPGEPKRKVESVVKAPSINVSPQSEPPKLIESIDGIVAQLEALKKQIKPLEELRTLLMKMN